MSSEKQTQENDLNASQVYSPPQSKIVDQKNDRKLPAATMLVIAPLVAILNFLFSFMIILRLIHKGANSFFVALILSAGIPLLLTWILQRVSKFHHNKARMNIFFIASLIILACQLTYLLYR
ncbi:hypothetical protein [Aliikangiella sp. G2MR2-5]|uniref:hypothetical protein n=1 Tax=Aliikangiella sp. G2MR2-5 TaxID=2788943 RepID=UPI0018A9A8BC|nr:hypothetical protein [Aliikangiella sp. G2MR2-5]